MALRWALSLLLILGGLGLFAALVYLSGPRLVWKELVAVGGWGFLAVLINVALSFFAWSWSWLLLLQAAGVPVRWRQVLSPMAAASAVTYLTPSAYLGGEPVRAYWIAKETEVSLARVMATAMVERLLAGVSLLAFASIGGFFALFSPGMSLVDKGGLALGLGIMALFLGLGVLTFSRNLRWLSRTLRALTKLVPWRGAFSRLAQGAAEMENQIHEVFAHRGGYALGSLLLQFFCVFLTYIRPLVFFAFSQGRLFTFPQLSLFFTLNVFIGAFLWVTPGGLGLADGGRAGAFHLLNVPMASAFAYNVLFRFVELLQVGIGLGLLLRRGFLRLRLGRLAVRVEKKGPDG